MVALKRRLQTPEAALTAALLIVFSALLFPLLGGDGGIGVRAVEASEASGGAPSLLDALQDAELGSPGAAEVRRLLPPDGGQRRSPGRAPEAEGIATLAGRDSLLESDVRRIILEAKTCAFEHSKGRVRSENITVGVHVRELGSGRITVAIEDGRSFRPASGMKLVTTAVALVLLGEEWHFETGFDGSGPIRDGVLEGDLIIRAGGDPIYAGPDSTAVDRRFDSVAEALTLRGIVEVSGGLVLDLSSFDDPEPGPEWPAASQHWLDYCALAAGLTANGGVIATRVRPTSIGRLANIEVWPAAHGLKQKYTTQTAAGRLNDVRVGATRSTVTVAGKIGIDKAEVLAEFSHPDPVLLFESCLRSALGRAGIRLGSSTTIVRDAPRAQRLFTLRSSLAVTLNPINADSVNGVADQLFFATGRAVMGRGSRAAGQLATIEALKRLGVSTEGLVQVDGSGLSRANRVSARQMATLLEAVFTGNRQMRRSYRDSLAVAGTSGTLENRMRDGSATGRVFAKTGWISGASSLSGIAQQLDGTECVFSILVEYPASESGLNKYCFKPMHDAIAERLVAGGNR